MTADDRAIIGLHLMELNRRRITSVEQCLYNRGLYVTESVRKVFSTNVNPYRTCIPLVYSHVLRPHD